MQLQFAYVISLLITLCTSYSMYCTVQSIIILIELYIKHIPYLLCLAIDARNYLSGTCHIAKDFHAKCRNLLYDCKDVWYGSFVHRNHSTLHEVKFRALHKSGTLICSLWWCNLSRNFLRKCPPFDGQSWFVFCCMHPELFILLKNFHGDALDRATLRTYLS